MSKKINTTSNRILALLIFLIVAHLNLIAIDVNNMFVRFPHLSRLSWLLPLCYGPLILLLTKSLVSKNFKFGRLHILYFLPFITYLIILTPFYFQSASEKILYLSDQEKVLKADFGWMNHLTNYFHVGFAIAALFVYKSHDKTALRSQSARKTWLGRFLYFIFAILVLSLFTFYTKKLGIEPFAAIYPNHFLLVIALVYWIAYKILQEKPEFIYLTETDKYSDNQPKYLKTGLDIETSRISAKRLLHHMKLEKPYLDPSLTITDLGKMLSLSKHQISQVINAEFDANFYEFINNYRIEEFKRQCQNPANAHLSLLGIAFEAGFNSKATFNQVFKKKEGITPSEFVKGIKRKDYFIKQA
ncbi:helix-turn-helix domain-containing protein [Dyadobacter sp. CY345]|uniref:helix-turn-helix domain-containing protein n=1 Tax=Dyadobacter sp. CY345 TaxID=2909335 RepID=UPI001F2075EF|nr:helix-turn-helix domain-containing protein [Dyadobacter sp. CY345]MCF2447277.1 helix-turn-helix domain-containing protein [Dyadobacter sp. CY345]